MEAYSSCQFVYMNFIIYLIFCMFGYFASFIFDCRFFSCMQMIFSIKKSFHKYHQNACEMVWFQGRSDILSFSVCKVDLFFAKSWEKVKAGPKVFSL